MADSPRDVVAVETRKGGDKWTFELNDPLPEFRWRSWHMVGLRSATPRVNFGGPVISNRLLSPRIGAVRDAGKSGHHAAVSQQRIPPRRLQFADRDRLHDQRVEHRRLRRSTWPTSTSASRISISSIRSPSPPTPPIPRYSGNVTEHASFKGTLLDSALSADQFPRRSLAAGRLDMILTPSVNEGNYFSQQTRTSSRLEWRETWSLSQQALGHAQPQVRLRAWAAPRSMR